jgi:hypothetical protein
MKTFSSEYHDYTNCASCQNASWRLSERTKGGMKPDPLYQKENKLGVNLGTRSLLNHQSLFSPLAPPEISSLQN